MNATYFAIKLRDSKNSIEALGMLPFASIEEVTTDVRAAVPDMVASLIRKGISPLGYSFLICDEHDIVLHEVGLRSIIMSPTTGEV